MEGSKQASVILRQAVGTRSRKEGMAAVGQSHGVETPGMELIVNTRAQPNTAKLCSGTRIRGRDSKL